MFFLINAGRIFITRSENCIKDYQSLTENLSMFFCEKRATATLCCRRAGFGLFVIV